MGDIEMAEIIVDKGKLDPSMYLVGMIKEENKMEKEMTAESIPKLAKMEEPYTAYGPELPPSSPVYGPELPPDFKPVVFGDSVFGDFETVEDAPALEMATEEEPIPLEGPKQLLLNNLR